MKTVYESLSTASIALFRIPLSGIRLVATYLGCTIFSLPVEAQQQPASPPTIQANPKTGHNILSLNSFHTLPYEFWLTCLICFVGLIVIGILTWSVHKMTDIRPEDVSRPIIVVTIVFGTLVLVTAGYSNEQIAPAFGLFGTIIGYILGRMSQQAAPVSQNAGAGKESDGSTKENAIRSNDK